jgi:hypothetical protein
MKIIERLKKELKDHNIVTEQDELDFHFKARRYHLCMELQRFETSDRIIEIALKELTRDNFQLLIKKYKGKR